MDAAIAGGLYAASVHRHSQPHRLARAMLQFTDSQLLGWIAAWFWPFCRIAALFSTAPIVQDRSIPQPVKVALAAMIAAVIAPGVQEPSTIPIFSVDGLLLMVQ